MSYLTKKIVPTVLIGVMSMLNALSVSAGLINITPPPTNAIGQVLDANGNVVIDMGGVPLTLATIQPTLNAAERWWEVTVPTVPFIGGLWPNNDFTINWTIQFNNALRFANTGTTTGVGGAASPSAAGGGTGTQAQTVTIGSGPGGGANDSTMFFWDQTPHFDE